MHQPKFMILELNKMDIKTTEKILYFMFYDPLESLESSYTEQTCQQQMHVILYYSSRQLSQFFLLFFRN